MLYEEFLAGTKAVDTTETFAEYQRVEAIYMQSDLMTKEDAYRMAKVETVAQRKAKLRKAQKAELQWVLENIISAAAFIRGMSEKEDCFRKNFFYASPCGNIWELREEKEINGRSVVLYSLWRDNEQIDLSQHCSYSLLPSAEFQSYRADWHDKSLKELEDLFGYIA